ncbi:DUF4917 family protein [Salmonella enterica]|nr:DUF4917 family protein [Salmonella enterica]EEO7309908.1 DUF4917 family protein [Salmonella enterica]
MAIIRNWNDIKDDYEDTLLLGNGASIAVNPDFSYDSLYQRLTNLPQGELLGPIFESFSSTDFELILHRLWIASRVNELLNVDETETVRNYKLLRDLLITCVNSNHAIHQNISDKLQQIRTYIGNFKTVLSLNYDLILYWAMLTSHTDRVEIKDCFVNQSFSSNRDWREFREVYRRGDHDKTCLVFYPHGSLALAQNFEGSEFKIQVDSSGDGDYLQQISQCWTSSLGTPVFVAEGTSEQKLNSIARSRYMNTIYQEILPEKKDSIVVYGWSFSMNDAHIINALIKSRPSRIAISVYNQNSDICDHLELTLKEKFGSSLVVEFFHSNSDDCWCY